MSIFWICILTLSIFSSFFQKSQGELTSAALEGAQNALSLCISLGGPLCLWCGVSKVMERAGLTEKLGLLLRPVFSKIFPMASTDPTTLGYLTANVSANLLGLGNAATPMGTAAVKSMMRLQNSPTASDEMCRLIVINTASIQLLPTTVAAIRSTAGTASPFDILPGVWITSLCSVTAGLLACRFLRRFYA